MSGHERLTAYGDIEDDLNGLIRRFGLPHSRENAHYPFWRLHNDGIWEMEGRDLVRTTASGDAHLGDLRQHRVKGGLTKEVHFALATDPALAELIVRDLLRRFFPRSLHGDVLEAVGLAGIEGVTGLTAVKSAGDRRDRAFRHLVLSAYEGRCALCRLDVRVDGHTMGLEAAHIQWHSAGGPAEVANGMALCALHHKFFDLGLFTVSSALTVRVGGLPVGESVQETLGRYDGLSLPIMPDNPTLRPASEFLTWHRRTVYKGKKTAG